MKKYFFLAASAAVVLSSCSNEEISDLNVAAEGKQAINISAYTPGATRFDANEAGSDSLVTYGFNLTAAYMHTVAGKDEVKNLFDGVQFYADAEGNCNPQNGALFYWPGADTLVNFYAYYTGANFTQQPCTLNVSSSDAAAATLNINLKTIDGIVQEAESDIMAATASVSGDVVELDFKHLMAQVKVTVNYSDSYVEDLGVDGVSFVLSALTLSAPSSSSYDYAQKKVSAAEGLSVYKFMEDYVSRTIVEVTDDNAETEPNLIGTAMIPASDAEEVEGVLSAVTACTLSLTYKVTIGLSEVTYTKSAPVKIAAGYLNNINVSLSGDKPISVTASVSGWDGTLPSEEVDL